MEFSVKKCSVLSVGMNTLPARDCTTLSLSQVGLGLGVQEVYEPNELSSRLEASAHSS